MTCHVARASFFPPARCISAALGTRFVAQGGPLLNQWDLAGTETTTDPWYMVAYSQYRYGQHQSVFIEDQPFARGNAVGETVKKFMAGSIELLHDNYAQNDFGDTHSLVLIVDSLNVQNTLLQLVPEAQRGAAAKTLDTVLRSASWRKAEKDSGQGKAEGDVLENVVNALADLCLGPQVPAARLNGSPDGNTWWSTTNLPSSTYTGRDAFYAKLKAITDSATYQALRDKVEIVATSSRARDDFGRFLALNDLAPFALKLSDATALAALKSANETLAQDWEADAALTAAQRAGGLAHFSDDWLADRADFLDRKNWFNAQNKNPVDPTVTPSMLNHRFQNPSITFKDVDSGYEIAQGVITDATKRMYFGGAENDALSGGRDADHLYGGGGADTLTGGAGRDRLEGGADDDRLEGGKDNDILLGGLGNDSYVFTSGDGWDWIDDRDGQGALRYDGKLLGSALAPIQKIAANTWPSHDGQITYSLYGGVPYVVEG